MTDFTRVKDKDTGHEWSVPTSVYDLAPDLYQKLDKPAENSDGGPLPAKHNSTVASKAAAKKAANVADPQKES